MKQDIARQSMKPQPPKMSRARAAQPLFNLKHIPLAVAVALGMNGVHAAPSGGNVIRGAASIVQSGNLTYISQASDRAVINWRSFSIGRNEAVQFAQPSATAAILNRVTGNAPSRLNGTLSGNGRVYLVNQNGIVVGANGVVNVAGGFVASTQDVSNRDFMQGGAMLFTGDNSGSIKILGKVSAPDGDVVLIAPKTEVAAGAELLAGRAVQLVAANEVQLSNGRFTVTPKSSDAGQITVAGALQAAQVQLAAYNNNLGALAINTAGTIRAVGTQANPDGSVSIVAAGQGGNVRLQNAAIVTGNADGSGGAVKVAGQNVAVQGAVIQSTGNVTIAAARDLDVSQTLQANGVGNAGSQVTLIAGNMIKTENGASIGADGSANLMLVAGHGVAVTTNVASIVGGLQDSPDVSALDPVLGLQSNNAFAVNNLSNNLVIANAQTNSQVGDVTLTAAGVVYSADPGASLTRSGITVNHGQEINIKTAGQLTLDSGDAPVTATSGSGITTTGNVFLEAGAGIVQGATGTINADSAVLTAATIGAPWMFGSPSGEIRTNVHSLGVTARAGGVYVRQAGDVAVSAQASGDDVAITTDNGSLTVANLNLTPTVTGNASGYTGNGVSTTGSGMAILTANSDSPSVAGDIVFNGDVRSETGDVVMIATRNVQFNQGQIRTAANAFVTALEGQISNQSSVPGATHQQIIANTVALNAAHGIGGGVIDNTKTGTDNPYDINLDVHGLIVNNADNSNVTLWNAQGIAIDNVTTLGYFGINAGGKITQQAATDASGAPLIHPKAEDIVLNVGGPMEFDTMRDKTIGQVDITTSGDLKVGGTNYVAGDFNATSLSGNVDIAGVLNVKGNVNLNGATIHLTGTINQGGNVIQNGVITHHDGAAIASVQVAGTNATITAYGASPTFDLSGVLTPGVLAGLNGLGVTTVTVNLGNTIASYSVAALSTPAIVLTQSGNVVGGPITVRTGDAVTTDPTLQARNYHLADGAGIDFGSKDVVVNAARGTNYAAGSVPSAIGAAQDTSTVGFDPTTGSNVAFLHSQTTGTWQVRDAYDTTIASPGNVIIDYLKTNRDAVILAAPNALKDLTVQGNVDVGRNMIAVAGRDLTLTASAAVHAGDRLTFVADEAAGVNAGSGWFRNLSPSVSSDTGRIAVYAVAGGNAPDGYTVPSSQIVLGSIAGLSENQSIDHWGTPFQTDSGGPTGWSGFAADGYAYLAGAGHFGGSMLWYKAAAPVIPAPPVTPVTPVTPVVPVTPVMPVISNPNNTLVSAYQNAAGVPFILWPVSFGIGIGEGATASGGVDIAYTCDAWSQRQAGGNAVLSVLKQSFMTLRHAKTDNKEALDNAEGELIQPTADSDGCSRNIVISAAR